MEVGSPMPTQFEDQIYCAAVRPGDTCFDVGAHLGSVTTLLAQLATPSGLVVSFEPVWQVYRQLSSIVQHATTDRTAPVVTVPMGLADRESSGTIQVRGQDFGMGSLAESEIWSTILPYQEVTSYACNLATLDRFLEMSELPKPDFLKIDVEGAELLVLRGAEGFFGSGARPFLLFELYAPWERAFGYGPWEVLSFLKPFGYRFLFACPEGLVEHDPSEEVPIPTAYVDGYNALAYHPDVHQDRMVEIDWLRSGSGRTILPMPPAHLPNLAG